MDESKIGQFLDVPGLQGLNRSQKARIEEFLKNPGKEEFFFFRRLLGKTPAQVRNMMVEEFIRRFDLGAYTEEIMEAFPSRRSWRELDVVAAQFGGSVEDEEHRLFWDRMRYVLAAVPQRKEFSDKYADKHELEGKRPKKGWQYTTCKFCWRTVPYNPSLLRKTGTFCFAHNLPAKDSVYRKHNRLLGQLSMEQQVTVKKLMELFSRCPSDEEASRTMLVHLTTLNECLPRLVEYLNNAGHNGEPESLLWAFHGPMSDMKDMLYKDALAEFIRDVLTAEDPFNPGHPVPFIFTIDELSRAEAWLTLLDRDGRRKKEGERNDDQ